MGSWACSKILENSTCMTSNNGSSVEESSSSTAFWKMTSVPTPLRLGMLPCKPNYLQRLEGGASTTRLQICGGNPLDQIGLALNILKIIGVCIFVDKNNVPDKPQRSIRARVWINLRKPLVLGVFLRLENGTTKWVDLCYEGVFIFYKKCGMIGHKTDYCRTTMEKAIRKILEVIMNLCTPEEDHLLTSPTDIPMYTNKVRGLKGILQNKTTLLDLRSSVQSFENNKFKGNSDSDTSSSSSKEKEDEDEGTRKVNDSNIDSSEENKRHPNKDRGKRHFQSELEQEGSNSSNSSDQGDVPSKKQRCAMDDRLTRE
ncbi:Halomucin [Bienertia sinuspersici]